MLDRVVSEEKKEKIQFYLGPSTIKTIYDRAGSFSPRKTQSKYITDLVERDVQIEKLDIEALRQVLLAVSSGGSYQGRTIGIDGAHEAVVQICAIFGIGRVP